MNRYRKRIYWFTDRLIHMKHSVSLWFGNALFRFNCIPLALRHQSLGWIKWTVIWNVSVLYFSWLGVPKWVLVLALIFSAYQLLAMWQSCWCAFRISRQNADESRFKMLQSQLRLRERVQERALRAEKEHLDRLGLDPTSGDQGQQEV